MEFRPILSALVRNKTGPILVALQVALSLGILANAVHIVNVRHAVAARPSGLADEHAVFDIAVRTLADRSPEQELADIKRQTDILRHVPGVVDAAQVSQMPMSRNGSNAGVSLDPRQDKESATVSTYVSGDSLVKTFGLKLVEGRDYQPQDFADAYAGGEPVYPQVVIITKALAEHLWPGTSAIGKTMYFGGRGDAHPTRIIGVVEQLVTPFAETNERGLQSELIPLRLYGEGRGTLFAVRAEPGQRDRVMKEAEAALRKSSALPMILELETTDENRKDRYRGDVALQWTLITVSALLVLITCCGIVGMASLWVTQRKKQIGVRRALGARRIDILRYFLAENFMITSAGVFGGVAFGLGLNQLLVSQLELERLPAGYLVVGAVGFWALGILAAYGPAWRAASISPAIATRSV